MEGKFLNRDGRDGKGKMKSKENLLVRSVLGSKEVVAVDCYGKVNSNNL
jgi:hypothetical protein